MSDALYELLMVIDYVTSSIMYIAIVMACCTYIRRNK